MIRVRLIGIPAAQGYLSNLQLSAFLLGTMRLQAGSDLPYAFGIETGHHRNGRLARRAGGAFYLRGAWIAVRGTVGARLARRLPEGPGAMRSEMQAIGRDVVDIARGIVPVRTGALQRSIRSSFRSR